MAWDVAVELQHQGHEVSVLAAQASYTSSAGVSSAADKSFKVKRVRELVGGRFMRWSCFWMQTLFALSSRRWDRCLLLTDPPFLPFAAWLTCFFRTSRQRVYWWTMDIYPEALVAAGMLPSGGFFNRCLRQLNELGLRKMGGVVALGPRQLQRLQTYRQWPSLPFFFKVVPPWDFRPLPKVELSANRVLDRLGCQGKKVALYTGNLGEGHLFDPFVAAASWFHQRGRTDWQFVFVVRGSGRYRLEAETSGLPNFQVCDYFPESETAALLWSATVHLVTMKPGWEGVIVPSKLYGALQTNAPVLFLGPLTADTATEIQRMGRGIALPPTASSEDVARALDKLTDPASLCEPHLNKEAPRQVAEFITQ